MGWPCFFIFVKLGLPEIDVHFSYLELQLTLP